MPIVRMPDGTQVRFPDDMPREQIRDMIAGKFPDAAKPQAPAANSDYFEGLPVPGTVTPQAAQESAPFSETPFAQATSGINEGIATALGAPVDIANLALRAGAAGVNAATGSDIQLPVNAFGGRETFAQAMAPAIQPESDNPANQVIRRAGEELGATLVPGLGVLGKSATPIRTAAGQAATALGSGAAAGVAQQISDNPYVELAAQILGGGSVAGLTVAGKRLVTPFPASPERVAAAQTLADEGVELTAGQTTGSKGLRFAESELGGGKAADLTERQMEQFTQAALSRAGIGATRATPEVMSKAYDDLGAQFDALAARNTISGDQQMVQDIGNTWAEYTSLVNESDRAPIIRDTITDIANALRNNGGTISGEAYKSMRSRLGRAIKRATDPELSGALKGLQGALDDAMERSMTAAGSPDLGAWQQVRSDYRNFLILQNAAAGAGENAAMGLISPAQLRSAVTRFNKGAYVRGQGDFATLARAGAAAMTPLPDSGTAGRLTARNVGMALPTLVGAGLGGASGDFVGGMMGAAAGAAVPNALGRMILSSTGRKYLGNQALAGKGNALEVLSAPAVGGAANALAAQQKPPLRIVVEGASVRR